MDESLEFIKLENFSKKYLHKKNKSLISCTKMNKYFLFPFITPIFITFRDSMIYTIINKNDKINFNLVYMLSISSCLVMAGTLYFTIDLKEFVERIKTIKILKNYVRIKNNVKKISKLKVSFILFIMGVSNSFYIFSVVYFTKHVILEKRQYTLFLIVFLSILILKIKIYKHQYLSLIFAFLGFLLLSIFKIREIPKEDIQINILSFVGTIFYAIHYIYLKYLYDKYELPIYICYIIVGILSIFFYFFAISIISKINNGDFSLFDELLYFFRHPLEEKKHYIFFAIFIINAIATELFVSFTIYYFSLTHFVLSSFISPILLYIIKNFTENKDETYLLIINFIGFAIELFAILIFNEIIVLNFCGLNDYTRKGINEREKEEQEKIDIDEKKNDRNNDEKIFEIDGYYIDPNNNDYIEKNEENLEENNVELEKLY